MSQSSSHSSMPFIRRLRSRSIMAMMARNHVTTEVATIVALLSSERSTPAGGGGRSIVCRGGSCRRFGYGSICSYAVMIDLALAWFCNSTTLTVYSLRVVEQWVRAVKRNIANVQGTQQSLRQPSAKITTLHQRNRTSPFQRRSSLQIVKVFTHLDAPTCCHRFTCPTIGQNKVKIAKLS